MKKPIQWKNEKRKVDDILPADYNPREMTDKEREDLMQSVKEFDTVVPVIINTGKRENVVIGGHQRIEIYKALGIEEIDVRVPSRELNKEEERELNLRLNKNTGHFVNEKLKEMGIELLIDVGFTEDDLSVMYDDVDIIDDEYPTAQRVKEIKTPITSEGDVWQLGKHTLIVGDSTDQKIIDKLMGKDKADMVYCDPPYNIGLNYTKGLTTEGKYGGKLKNNDSLKNNDYRTFIEKTVQNALEHTKKDAHIFYWCDERYIGMIQSIYEDNSVDSKRVCLWIKNNFNMTPQIAFNKVYEPCVYGTRGKPYLNKNIKNLNEILNKEVESGNQVHDEIFSYVNLWIEKRDVTTEYEHPTQKPVSLHDKPLKRCTGAGHIVMDLFGGSGSTLIACEQLNRICKMVEQDPIFATVIIERWEAFTGGKAKLL